MRFLRFAPILWSSLILSRCQGMKRMSDRTFIDSNIWLYALVLNPGDEDRHRQA